MSKVPKPSGVGKLVAFHLFASHLCSQTVPTPKPQLFLSSDSDSFPPQTPHHFCHHFWGIVSMSKRSTKISTMSRSSSMRSSRCGDFSMRKSVRAPYPGHTSRICLPCTAILEAMVSRIFLSWRKFCPRDFFAFIECILVGFSIVSSHF